MRHKPRDPQEKEKRKEREQRQFARMSPEEIQARKDRRSAAARKRYAEREEVRKKSISYSKKQSKTDKAREYRKLYKEKLRRQQGCKTRAEIKAESEDRRAMRTAEAKAERKVAREAKQKAEYEAMILEKPWRDKSLTPAQKWKLRYALDPEWREKEYARMINAKMLRRYKMQTPGVSGAEIKALKDAYHACVYCMKPLTHQQKTVDHVVPLSRGGLHEIGNLTIACGSCNAAKSDRDADEFRQQLVSRQAA